MQTSSSFTRNTPLYSGVGELFPRSNAKHKFRRSESQPSYITSLKIPENSQAKVNNTTQVSDTLQVSLPRALQKEAIRPSSHLPNRIILIRHGESQGNVDNSVYLNTPDNHIGLSKKGHDQAHEAGLRLKSIVQDEKVRFFVSPYRRTRQTFAGIVQSLSPNQFTAMEEPRLREQEWGHFQSEGERAQVEIEREKTGHFYYRFGGGESGADVYDRITTFLSTMFRDFQYNACNCNYVLISHGLAIRLFLMRWYKWSVERFQCIENVGNCEFMIMEKRKKKSFELITHPRYWTVPDESECCFFYPFGRSPYLDSTGTCTPFSPYLSGHRSLEPEDGLDFPEIDNSEK